MEDKNLELLLDKQRNFFNSQITKSIKFRKEQLKKLLQILKENKDKIFEVLKLDLGKSYRESYMSEYMMCTSEIKFMLKNLNKLSKVKKVKSSLALFPAKSIIKYEPLGITYIVSPFNYPFQLTIVPLIDSIAAGNTNIIRMSDKVKNTKELIKHLLNDNFDSSYIRLADIDHKQSQYILENSKVDHLIFTGSTNVGKVLMEQAAKSLTKVTLELGGKSPCIVLDDADFDLAAKRIVYAKYLNVGQTCIAVDHVYVSENNKEKLINKLKEYIIKFYSSSPIENNNYGKIIDQASFDRLTFYLNDMSCSIVFGGKFNQETLKIEPTIVTNIKQNSNIDTTEIFGPILPIYTYTNELELKQKLDNILFKSKPLAFYIYTRDKKKANYYVDRYSFGGGCINDSLMHIVNHHLPFGGVNTSGLNSYHGKFGFINCSHEKSILVGSKFSSKLRFPPFDDDYSKIDKLSKFM